MEIAVAGKFTSYFDTRQCRGRYLLVALALLALSACGTTGQGQAKSERSLIHGVVARDLLFVAAQLFPPLDTTIQLGKPNSAFGAELEKGLREIGYGLQRIKSDQGQFYLSYSESSRSTSSSSATLTYSMYIGDVGLERAYANVDGAGVAPLGPMKVFGTNRPVNLSEEMFPGQSLEVEYANSSDVEIDLSAITIIDKEIMAAITDLRTQPIPSYKTLNSQSQEIENLFGRGSSNFAEVDRDYRTVRKDVVVFADDSLSLLEKGRMQIGKMVDFYQPETDVFRLVGCSNGPTNYSGGNVGLALGRSERIAKELLSRKVKETAIFDEGCWAGEATAEFPSRGVVIELQRRNI